MAAISIITEIPALGDVDPDDANPSDANQMSRAASMPIRKVYRVEYIFPRHESFGQGILIQLNRCSALALLISSKIASTRCFYPLGASSVNATGSQISNHFCNPPIFTARVSGSEELLLSRGRGVNFPPLPENPTARVKTLPIVFNYLRLACRML